MPLTSRASAVPSTSPRDRQLHAFSHNLREHIVRLCAHCDSNAEFVHALAHPIALEECSAELHFTTSWRCWASTGQLGLDRPLWFVILNQEGFRPCTVTFAGDQRGCLAFDESKLELRVDDSPPTVGAST